MAGLSRLSLTAVLLTTAAGSLLAPVASAQGRRAAARPTAPRPFLDVRDGRAGRTPGAGTRSARARLRSRGAVVAVDGLTGTPRLLAGRSAPLSPRSRGDRRDAAERYLRTHLTALGLGRADLGSLRLEQRRAIPGGAQLLGYRQFAAGIPSFDGGLRVAVDSAGRVTSVSGPVQPGLSLPSAVPALSAADAMRRLMASVGVRRTVRVASGPAGPARSTEFTSGERASLVAFAEGTSARLGWQLDLRAGPAAHYAAVVDAASGRILYRANRVKSAANDALVWEQYPGAANGGTAQVRDLTPYLNPGATDLSGPYAHAWSDTNDNDSGTTSSDGHIIPFDHPDAGEAVGRSAGSFVYGFTPFTQVAGACDTAHKCSWDFDTKPSWQTNRAQNAVQAFYYVNRFRDHLLASPIAFTPADGSFDNGDRVLVNTDDGAATGSGGGPDSNHRDNAYMDTPPDGTSPTMAMFLFFNNGDFRDINGGDDAAIVYHEYTHGLSSRLVTNGPGGEQALNGDQSGAMGEAWSDWYAKDFLLTQFPGDDTAAPGEVDMGKYTDSSPHTIRSQALDCPVGASAGQCPGATLAGPGGYTYGDFGKISGTGPEVHADGEIWGETLWDVRAAVGSAVARAIITQGMRISPPEPTFLDERDAILTADRQLFPDGDHSGALWAAFAARGMGSNALSPSQDVVVEGFKRPPTAALSVSPAAVVQGSAVSLDASGSSDPDGSVTSYDFDFFGDGTPDVTGATNPRQTFAYPRPGTFHPTVTVHDNEGQTDTAARRVDVAAPSAPPPPPPVVVPASRRPVVTLVGTGKKGRVRFTVRCDSACTGSAKLTVTRKLAKRLHLGKRRTVGTLRVKLAKAGSKRFTVKLSKRTLRAMKRAGVRRLATRLSVTVTDRERQRTARKRTAKIRR
jgi:extracellular elastinolytic metalloproteinase